MVPAVTSQADGCGSSKSQVQAQVLFLSETKIDRSYPNLGGGVLLRYSSYASSSAGQSALFRQAATR